jgi:PBP1b-binding outer membrane lipoprotein LpoB
MENICVEAKMQKYLLWIVCAMTLAGCGRSPEEQLAYQHAEEQYQINQDAGRYRQSLAEGGDKLSAPAERGSN